jgi:PAS domain S-box-containing protein
MTNIDEDKRAEETLREQAEMLNLAPILTRDLDDKIIFWNQGMEELYGWSRTEALGRVVHELLQTRFPQPLQEIRVELWRAGSWKGELSHTRRDGSQVVVISRWVLHRDKAGQPFSIFEVNHDITQLKQAEVARYESEERFQAFMANLPVLTYIKDAEGRYLFVNRAFEETFGRPLAEWLGKTDTDLFSDPLSALRQANDQAVTNSGRTLQFHEAIQLTDGEHHLLSIKFQMQGQGQAYLGGVAIDITEQKRMEKALRLSEEQFAKAFQASPDALTISRANGVFLEVNPGFEKIFGYSRQEALGQDPVNLNLYVDPTHRTQIRNLFRAQGFLNNYEMEFQTKTGEKRYTHLSVEAITINNEPYLLTINQDITDRKQAELALRESEERFRELFENAKDIIYTLDLHGNLTSMNRAGELIFGYGHEELLHQSIARLIAPEYMERMVEMRTRKLEGAEVTTYELEAMARDGRRMTLEVSSRLIYERGTPTGIQGIARDITERKWAEAILRQAHETLEQRVAERTEELERTLQDLNQFTYAASHDLKAPLRAVKHLAGWIAEDADEVLSVTSKTHLAKLENRIQRMEKFLDDLLIYSRIERQYYQHVENVEVKTMIEEIVEVLAPPPGFTLLIQPDLPRLRTQRVLLELVLKNLIENAIKHHERSEGRVQISSREGDDFTEFSVTDDGPGIDQAFHERIFQIFQTLRPRDEVEGSGAGLAIVKKVVESRGGTITVISAEGEGATFRFTWPKN